MLVRNLVEAGFVMVLIAVVPVLSFRTSRQPEIFALPRLKLYLSAVVSQWILAALGIVVLVVTSEQFAAVGFRMVPFPEFLLWTAALAGVSLAALGLVVFLENREWWPPEPKMVYALIPQTPTEKLWAVLVIAPTAALCEEFLYRGLLLAMLSQWLHSAGWGLAVSSAAFVMAHMYQGFSGVARAALLGALLAVPMIRLGTIFPSMASHFLIDAVALIWLGPKMIEEGRQ